MPKKPKIRLEQVRSISRMLAQNLGLEEIEKKVMVSKTTIDRARADYNIVTYQAAFNRLDLGAYLEDPEFRSAVRKAKGVDGKRREAILQGIADAKLRAQDILDEVPEDPRLAFATQGVDHSISRRLFAAKPQSHHLSSQKRSKTSNAGQNGSANTTRILPLISDQKNRRNSCDHPIVVA